MIKCEVCGYEGEDVHEYPTYSKVLGRDTTEYQCDDITACLDRKWGKRNFSLEHIGNLPGVYGS